MSNILASDTTNHIRAQLDSISSTLAPASFMDQAIQVIHNHARIHYVGILLLNQKEESVVFSAGSSGDVTEILRSRGYMRDVASSSLSGIGAVIRVNEILLVGYGEAPGRVYSLPAEPEWNLEITFKEEYPPIRFISPLLPETRWELLLPLRTKKKARGILWIHCSEDAGFDLEDITHFQSLADQIAKRLW